MNIDEQLLNQFGHSSFRPGQKETIESLLKGRDTLAMLPTGSGKSLCYQLPAYRMSGAVLIVSPLLSLMQDQVDQLKASGEKRVIALNSFLQKGEKSAALERLDQFKFIFLSPEMLQFESVLNRLKRMKLALFVVDEAHCISQWGYDFRPDYSLLGEVRKALQSPCTLALTATADQHVRDDIKQKLALSQPDEWVLSVNRPNIAVAVQETDPVQKQTDLQSFVAKLTGPGIVYTSARKTAEELAFILKKAGISKTAFYHGGMTAEDRLLIQHQFLRGDVDVICATSAFGMGINKNDVRFVIHYHMPPAIEAYLQEIGRAGRDGKPAVAVLLYAPGDEQLHDWIAQSEFPTDSQINQYAEQHVPPDAVDPPLTDNQKRFLVHYAARAVREKQQPFLFMQRVRSGLLERKKRKRDAMLQWIRSEGCRREGYLALFQEQPAPQIQCCDRCGLDWTEYEQLRKLKPEQTELAWDVRLKQLFHEQ